MSWLQNSWMDNTAFLAEMAHFAWAYGILLTAALWSVALAVCGQRIQEQQANLNSFIVHGPKGAKVQPRIYQGD